jgi:hypothetical protein
MRSRRWFSFVLSSVSNTGGLGSTYKILEYNKRIGNSGLIGNLRMLEIAKLKSRKEVSLS